MSYEEFWHGDMCLLSVAQKAYYRDRSYTAWLQGQFDSIAYGVVMSNAFAKKGSKQAEYPQWKDPFEKFENRKNKIQNNIEQRNQEEWFFNLISK